MKILPFRHPLSLLALKYACISPSLFQLEKRFPFTSFTKRLRDARTEMGEESFVLRNLYRVGHGKADSDDRFVICADIAELYSGLGVFLLMLGPCWKYALKTGRTLVIDWRGNPYTRSDPARNLFTLLFEPPDQSEIGVPCIADDSVNDLRFPQPVLGPSEAIPQESGEVHNFPGTGVCVSDMRQIIACGLDVDFPTVMPSLGTMYGLAKYFGPMGWNWPPMFTFREGRRLYGSLRVRPRLATLISEFHQAHMTDRPVIGVHVRHGNGEGRFRDHFKNREIRGFPGFIESLVDKIRRFAADRFGGRCTVFLCTDSDEVVRAMEPSFDSLVSRRIWRPAPGEGIDFDHAYKRADGGEEAVVDALVDMRLLAKCDAVLMARPTDFASHVPYIMEKPGAVFLNHEQVAKI